MLNERYVIEINDEAVGLVVGESPRRGVTFHAVHPRLYAIEGRRFSSTREAIQRARAILSVEKSQAH